MLRSIVYISMILETWTAVIAWIMYLRVKNKIQNLNSRYYPLPQSVVDPKQKDAVSNKVDKLTSWVAFYKQIQNSKEGYMFTSTAAFEPTHFIYKNIKYGFVTLDDMYLYREWYFQNITKINITTSQNNYSLNQYQDLSIHPSPWPNTCFHSKF